MGLLLIKEIKMKHIAAYALLVLGGKAEPKAADVSKVLKEAGATADDDKVKALCEALKGKQFHELVAEGSAKLGSMGSGSGAPAAGGAAAGGDAAPAKEAPKEEEPEEDVDMGGLFGDDDY